ncbi:MAG TPA: hypothetical protein VGC15_08430 [Acetobacteraceae bacterium]
MIELVLMYCLSSDVAQCVQPREIREPMGSPIECAMRAQTLAQEFVIMHPKYRLSGWRCEVDKPREEPA